MFVMICVSIYCLSIVNAERLPLASSPCRRKHCEGLRTSLFSHSFISQSKVLLSFPVLRSLTVTNMHTLIPPLFFSLTLIRKQIICSIGNEAGT